MKISDKTITLIKSNHCQQLSRNLISHILGQNTKKNQSQAKNVALTQRPMNITRSRQITTIETLPYDLFNSSLLFDADLPSKPQKNILSNKLEIEIIFSIIN